MCDNLCFDAEIVVSARHTKHGADRYVEGITNAAFSLHGFAIGANARIMRFRDCDLTDDLANSLILQTYRRGIVGARLLPKVCDAWEKPRHEEFEPKTMWSLQQAFTEALKPRQQQRPAEAAAQTIRLQRFLEERAQRVPQLTTAV